MCFVFGRNAFLSWAALFGCLSLVSTARASEASAEIIAPLVDRQTLLVAHIDLLAFDASETIDWLTELLELSDDQHDRMKADTVLINLLRTDAAA